MQQDTYLDTARLLLENVYKHFRLPDKIILDRGPQFALKAFIELPKLLEINQHFPQLITLRLMEQQNESIKK